MKRDVVVQNYEYGGLKMINVLDVQTSYLLKWVKQLVLPGNGSFRVIPQFYFDKLGKEGSVFNSSISSEAFIGLDLIKSKFYKKLLLIWLKSNSNNCKTNDNLFNNSRVLYRGNPIFFKSWIKAGLIFIKDILVDNNNVMSYDSLCQRVPRTGETWFQYNTVCIIINKIKRTDGIPQHVNSFDFRSLPLKKISCKQIRNEFTKDRRLIGPNRFSETQWTITRKITKDAKIIDMQWKIMHNIFPTRKLLFKYRVDDVNSELCIECNQIDTIKHYFFDCKNIKEFWNEILPGITANEALYGKPSMHNDCYKKVLHLKRCIVISKRENCNLKSVMRTEKY